MTDRKISNFEFATINCFITRALLIGITFNILTNIVKQDSWIIPLVSFLPALVIIFLLNFIMDYKPKLNIAEKIRDLFNKTWFIILFIIITLIYIVCLINSLNMINFIQSQFLNKTPLYVIIVLFMLAAY